MNIDILSLFPDYFTSPLDQSIVKRARQKGLVNISHTDIRDFAISEDRRVDDRPYGGGPGMVLMAEPVVKAVQSVEREASHVIYLSPQGKLLTAAKSRELATKPHLILLCGHYEGIDERAIEEVVDEEISIGDYVLTNGCIAAIVLLDAVIRFIPGVLGHAEAASEDSFENGLLDCPHYTRPEVHQGKTALRAVPPVLLSGNHKEIAKWRKEQAINKTKKTRPELLQEKNHV